MNLTGKIIKIMDTNVVSERFKKREFVIETAENPMYPQHILLEFNQDKCGLLDKYSPGQMVDVEFNIRGKCWNGGNGDRYFVTLQAWKISLETKF